MARARLMVAVALLLPRLVLACEPDPGTSPFDGLCALASGRCSSAPGILVLSAFPAEQSVLRSMVQVTERVEILGRSVLIGWLSGQRVVLALTGIGLVNATTTAEVLASRYDLSAILFSGVAGSTHRIADVAVPTTWFVGGTDRSFAVDPALLAAAEAIAASGLVLDRCTPVPPVPPGMEVCMPHVPGLFVGGEGISSDPFGGGSFPCRPGGDEVFGCEARPLATPPPESEAEAVDMETAVVAEVAAAHAIPFLGVRGVSDGPGDPLGLPGFPQQFFAYYRISADNAAAVVARLLEELPPPSDGRARAGRDRLRAKAACAFERAVGADCADVAVPRRVARLVSQACALRAKAAEGDAARAERRVRLAAARWRRAATLVERGALPSCCATSLTARLRAAADAMQAQQTLRMSVAE